MSPPATRGPGLCGLHVLADDDPRFVHDPVAQARAACRAGAAVVQLRAKHASDRRILALGEPIRALTREAGVRFFVNDRFDLALLLEADGVHLGQEDLPPGALPAEAHRTLPPDARRALLVGRSTHDRAQALRAVDEGADYVAFGPVFETASKDTGYAARGLRALREIAEAVAPLPVVAIGGVDAARAPALVEAGARGLAVISAVAAAPDPEAAARALCRAMASAAAAGGAA